MGEAAANCTGNIGRGCVCARWLGCGIAEDDAAVSLVSSQEKWMVVNRTSPTNGGSLC
ncbi:MAG: hypothetical protein MET45_20595 [Nostoc sp. LLA-1]|nr:hypothetical protein [Cyanocohniella sp. LLY]